jgi:hypothetical protein
MSSIQHSEMGLSFWKASHAPLTPPTSPKAPPRGLKRQTSWFRLPKILNRMRPVDSNISSAAGTIAPSDPSDFIALNSPKEDESSLEPFRTKQPLPSVMPAVPKSSGTAEGMTETTSKKLRKMPKSHHNLRQYKFDNQLSSQQSVPPIRVPALLPSPLPSDTEEDQCRKAYFAFQNPREPAAAHVKAAESSYECEGIVAGYCEDVFEGGSRDPEGTSAIAAERKRGPHSPPRLLITTDVPAARRTPATSNMSATLRSPKRERSSSLSSEATWLSKSFASPDRLTCLGQLERIKMNEKRLAEKSRRCCHLIQGPSDDVPASWIGERKAVGVNKARLCRLKANHAPVVCYCHQAGKGKRHLGATIDFHQLTVPESYHYWGFPLTKNTRKEALRNLRIQPLGFTSRASRKCTSQRRQRRSTAKSCYIWQSQISPKRLYPYQKTFVPSAEL